MGCINELSDISNKFSGRGLKRSAASSMSVSLEIILPSTCIVHYMTCSKFRKASFNASMFDAVEEV